MTDIKQEVLNLIASADAVVPSSLKPDLPPGKSTSGQPEWHEFEYRIWELGEQVRRKLVEKTALRKDSEIQQAILDIATAPNAKRGRQSFIMLLGYTSCAAHASEIATQLGDPCVCGHAVDTLLKMRSPDFVEQVRPFIDSEFAWIRRKAKRYVERYEFGS